MEQINGNFRSTGRITVRRTPKSNNDVDRGKWTLGEPYYCEEVNPSTFTKETSHTWYLGCKFKCKVSGTTSPPLWNSPDWEFEEGNPDLVLKWIGDEDSVFEEDPSITLAVSASLYNQDLTDEGVIRWTWTRESSYDGVQDTVSDDIWNAAHDNIGNSVDLELADMNYRFGKHPDNLVFMVTATLIDNNGKPMVLNDVPMITKMKFSV